MIVFMSTRTVRSHPEENASVVRASCARDPRSSMELFTAFNRTANNTRNDGDARAAGRFELKRVP